MGTGEMLGKPDKLQGSDLRWTSIPSRGNKNTPSCFMLQKLGKAPAAMSQSAPRLHFFFFFGLDRSYPNTSQTQKLQNKYALNNIYKLQHKLMASMEEMHLSIRVKEDSS